MPPRARARAAVLLNATIIIAAALLGVLVLLQLAGCAGRSGAQAETREIRLTRDEVAKHAIRFSPDGRLVAYTARPSGEKQTWGIFVIPREGGQPRRISPDTVGVFGLTWTADGKGLYARGTDGDKIYYVSLDGSLKPLASAGPLTRLASISPDGKTELLLRFNGDNRDLGLRESGGKFKFLAATPAWEEDAVFGPGRGEITVVAVPSYQAPVSTISVWSPQTGKFTPLPLPEGLNSQPTWSPDGRYLVYVSYLSSQYDLWIYDPRTARAAPLTSEPTDVGCPAWSPDGEWLAFCRSDRTSHLFLGDPRKAVPRQLTQGLGRDFSPMVSPDGKWVAFLRRSAGGSGGQSGPTLCVMPASGGPVAELDLGGAQVTGKGDAMCWSRDGRRIAFQGVSGSGKTDIYEIDRDGSGLARVTVEPGEEVAPMWSPDGRYISYTQAGGGRLQVAVIPAHGGLARVVSHEKAPSEGGAWAPDSDRLAYLAYGSDGIFEIWITSLTHPETRKKLLADKLMAWPAFWSRDGKEILLARGSGSEWYYTAYSLEKGQETRVGRVVMLPSGNGEVVDLEAQGEKYRDLFYPGGTHVYADGKDNTDVYLVRARELLESRLLAARGE
jgi:Tol biopolymer transport system component